MSIEDILDSRPGDSASSGIADLVGQVIEITEATFENGKYGDVVRLTINNGSEEQSLLTGAKAIVPKVKALQEAGHLPCKVKVTSYPTQFGKDGYDIRSEGFDG